MCIYSVLLNTADIEKSQPLNIPDAAKRRKKKRRTRATDSFTGNFDGNDRLVFQT